VQLVYIYMLLHPQQDRTWSTISFIC